MSAHRVSGRSKRLSAKLRTALPVFDAVVIRGEAVFDTPQHGLGSAADADLAVDRADVRLHGVRTQKGQPCDVGVALALRDERQNLGFPVAETFSAPRP